MQNDKANKGFQRSLCATGLAAALLFAAGCHSNNAAAAGQDPADANLAPANGQSTQVMGENASYAPQQQGEAYPEGQQAPAPVERNYNDQNYDPNAAEQAGEEAIEETDQAPPPLPDYDQPPAPGPDYLWTPGYWAWGPGGYYWVPGAWVEAPYYGALWTPPYWGWYGGHYRFHSGYWGPHVGYYGGIDYGYGYIGIGYFGGYWSGNNFYYNRSVTRVGGGIRNVYDRPVVYNNTHYGGAPRNRVSYNGGRGGINVQPRPSEIAAGRERHVAALPVQRQVRTSAAQNRGQFFNQNHGRPAAPAETHGFANSRGIAPTPRGVEPGRPGMPPPNAAGERGNPSRPVSGINGTRQAPNPGVNPRVNPGNNNNVRPTPQNQPRAVEPQPRMENRPGTQPRPGPPNIENRGVPQQRMQTPQPQNRPAPQQRLQTPQVQNRPAPQQRAQPQPRVENRAVPPQQRVQPQPRVENRPAPQPQRMQEARPESRPAPQQRAQAPRAAAPPPQSHAAPPPRGGNDHPQGDEHGHR